LVASFLAWKEQYDARIAAENLNHDSNRKREIGLKLAALMTREPNIRQRLISAPNNANEFALMISERDQWVQETAEVLKEAELPTEAVAFSQISNLTPLAEEVNEFRHVEEWKRGEVMRLAMYRKKLDQIRDSRRL
jgi:hypothetical protein